MSKLREWMDSDPALYGPRGGCLLTLAFCFLFWAGVIALGWWLLC